MGVALSGKSGRLLGEWEPGDPQEEDGRGRGGRQDAAS